MGDIELFIAKNKKGRGLMKGGGLGTKKKKASVVKAQRRRASSSQDTPSLERACPEPLSFMNI